MKKNVGKKNNRKGFTMAELLLVVAIIAILTAVGFIALARYLRILRQLEFDSISKEIFISAQNHLTMTENEGYLDADYFGEADGNTYYFAVNNSNMTSSYQYDSSKKSVLNLILPFASIDETIRTRGSYVIRYQKSPAKVLDVFYSRESDTTFGATFIGTGSSSGKTFTYETLKNLTGDDKKADRKNQNGAVIGWYGGESAGTIGTSSIAAPTLIVENGDKLIAKISNLPGSTVSGETINVRLVIKGLTSGAQAYKDLSEDTNFVLDDITTTNFQFKDINNNSIVKRFDVVSGTFTAGENISVQAIAYSNTVYSNIGYSEERITSSLFADGSTITSPLISSFRHLENLDNAISDYAPEINSTISARQINDLTWDNTSDSSVFKGYNYKPVNIGTSNYTFTYNGDLHKIKKLKISLASISGSDFGVFGSVTNGKLEKIRVENINYPDTTVKGNSGGLVGSTNNTTVSDVIVYLQNEYGGNYNNFVIKGINSGGLVGLMTGGSITDSAAAIKVSGTTAAGGLVGNVNGSGAIQRSYSGGHTYKGTYNYTSGNISGATAGGLIGTKTGDGALSVDYCYSTCSVNGTSVTGGFIGSIVGSATIQNCYATGLVTGTGIASFTGTGSATYVDCNVLEIVNYTSESGALKETGSKANETNIVAIDSNVSYYQSWLGTNYENKIAHVYDRDLAEVDLKELYQGKYSFKTINQMCESGPNEHYGDFPAYETIVINTSN